jgi:hypothetical protein
MRKRRDDIYDRYKAWQAEKDRIGTVEDLCKSLGITRQRLYKVVALVEAAKAQPKQESA